MLKRLFASPEELFKTLRLAYLPLLLGYFAHSLSGMYGMGAGITTIPSSFWTQEKLLLSPEILAFISFTVGLPWISKVLFGQLVDSWAIRRRKRVLIAAGAFMMLGFYILASLAGDYHWLAAFKHNFGYDPALGLSEVLPEEIIKAQKEALIAFQFFFLALGYLIVSMTMCLQDVILDPMGRHIVSKTDESGHPLSNEP